jgi:hypothetical protein
VRNAFDLRATEILGQIADGLIETQMSPTTGEQVSDVFSDCLI